MLSFINIMGKKNPDEEDEEEGSENGKKKVEVTGIIGWQDALILVVIALGIFGGYKYYQYTKEQSSELFARCALLYDGGDLLSAKACYDSTWELSYTPNEMDSLRVIRLGLIDEMKSAQEFVLEDARNALAASDTAKALSVMRTFNGPVLLSGEDARAWDSLRTAFAGELLVKPALDSTASGDSTEKSKP